MNKVAMLQEADICNVIKAFEHYSAISSTITDRVDYIIRFCVEAVKGKFSWWDWQNGGDGDDRAPGDFMHSYSKHTPDTITITGEWTNGSKMTFIDKNGDEFELEWGEIPTRWLYEEFEEEFKNGLKLYEEKKQAKTAKRKEMDTKQKEERKGLIAAARSKLTKEERKALGLK
jgi:hypothetical protein